MLLKAGFFLRWIFKIFLSRATRIFSKLKMCDKVLFSNYTLKQK